MKIIKRSGTEVTFDIAKIMAAVSKANKEVVHSEIQQHGYRNVCRKQRKFTLLSYRLSGTSETSGQVRLSAGNALS